MEKKEKVPKITCIACHNTKFSFLERVKYPIKNFSVYQCLTCGLATQFPLPTKKELKKFYTQIYDMECNLPCAEKAYTEMDEEQEAKRFEEVLLYKKTGKLLDVGASSGFFLSEVNKHKGWSGEGVEYVKKAVEEAKNRFNMNLTHGEIQDVKKDNYFDVVTMHSVLEHLPDPVGAIEEVSKKLKKKGVFIFNVPNISSFELHLYTVLNKSFPGFIYEHLHYYTKKSLKLLLAEKGFKIRKITSRHHSHLSLPPKLPLIGWLTFPFKLLLEYTDIGGTLNKGNILYVYAEKI